MGDADCGFELRDHTADIALFAWGTTPDKLFAAAATGLYAAIGELHGTGHKLPATTNLQGRDQVTLLVDFLSELLFKFETAHVWMVDPRFEELTETHLRMTGLFEPLDVNRCQYDREVKAVTHHNLAIRPMPGRLETTIILDI
ncbi:MAG: archease [Phycisphaerae bacterium]